MDDDLIDYYGVNYRTYQDYECVEMMQKVFETKGMMEDNPNIPIGVMLMDEDKDLLEDFATLFNSLHKSFDLYESMLGLLKLVREHRSNLAYEKNIKPLNEINITNHKKDVNRRLIAFKNNLYSLFKMIDTTIATKKSQALKEMLLDAKANPYDYLNHKRSAYNASTKKINDYLKSLNLYKSNNKIKDFINSIKPISH